MVLEILTVALLAVAVLCLWRISAVLTLAVNNQVELGNHILLELNRIRAGLFAHTRIKDDEGWSKFEELSNEILTNYIAPRRSEREQFITAEFSFWGLFRRL